MGLTAIQFVESLTVHGLMSNGEATSLLKECTVVGGPEPDVEKLVRKLVQDGKLTKFQAVNLYQGRGKGLLLGDYLILDKIGAGAMGKVYKAKHRRMNRVVALKVLSPHVSAAPKIIDRFFREVQVAARMSHPNVVAAYDSGESQGLHYLVMEFVEGRDLLSYADANAPLGVDCAIDLIRQAAEGLAYAHEQNVVHRDVKPANILVTHDGRAKILDLGLARIMEDESTNTGETQNVLTVEGEVMGTPDYMAPEQSFDTHTADHRADIYALGCSLYRILTGRIPYPGDTPVQKVMAHHDQPIPSLRGARADVPAELETLYQKMMAKSPQDRVQSARVAAEQLATIGAALKSAR
ncbi:MAG: serine/threonine protein kinase [Planctomycetaceae bacterium]|nr:serine/threonine protein kinase [Planctomycetaceae bacterium]